MEVKKKYRSALRSSFTKCANELEHLLAAETLDLPEISVNWTLLCGKNEVLETANNEICSLLLESVETSEADLEAEMDSVDSYKRRFVALERRYHDVQPSEENTSHRKSGSADDLVSAVGSNSIVTGRRKFKLPRIELPKFDGNIRDWLPFWGQFSKIDRDPDIDDSDKIQYLIQSTVAGSRARQLVESFPAIGENYKKVINVLKSRFGRDDLQIEVYIREMLGLIINNAGSNKKLDLSTLYDRLETQLRALETLGVASDKCSAMLFPLIESCLPSELLRIWQRSRVDDPGNSSMEIRLESLMKFLRGEVENEQRVTMAAQGLGLVSVSLKDSSNPKKPNSLETKLPTATGLMNCDVTKCIFCDGGHASDSCFKAQKFSIDQKKTVCKEKKVCFKCLKFGHLSIRCRSRVRCIVCGRAHVALMCPDVSVNKTISSNTGAVIPNRDKGTKDIAEQTLTNNSNCMVFLQTLRVTAKSESGCREIRALIDTGSQRSYLLKSTIMQLGYTSKREELIAHGLFGGVVTQVPHKCYDVRLCNENYACKFEVLDQQVICTGVPAVGCGPWIAELKKLNIQVDDTQQSQPIELLIGADVAGKLYTGNRRILACGLVAVETLLGWTLMGKFKDVVAAEDSASLAATTLSLLLNDTLITNLWELDTLGIKEPSEKKSREERDAAARDFFKETVTRNVEGRYEVRLPWMEGHRPLPSNLKIAEKRLQSTLKKLKKDSLVEAYDAVFQEWLTEGIIEQVSGEDCFNANGHYLPHRPVIKEGSSTTKIRPVFDASARETDSPSLNHCLEKGQNLIELIPSILVRFRENPIGVVADIRKAFLQISVHEKDRDFLRFLWIDFEDKQIVFRHRRVVFGVNSSPFLLGATIEHHLTGCLEKVGKGDAKYSLDTIEKLARGFYVDNCVVSVPDKTAALRFIQEATEVMKEANFDLRGWQFNDEDNDEKTVVPLLGLDWYLGRDVIKISDGCLQSNADFDTLVVSKRLILSMAQRVFDVIGYTCPTTLVPKLILQQLWEKKLTWDEPVDADAEGCFREWFRGLPHLKEIEIPRWIGTGLKDVEHLSLHIFSDASKVAFAAVIFLRVVRSHSVTIHIVAAKARVAPVRKLTIPRLELLAAVIGARLYEDVRKNLQSNAEPYFWTDSSTVLSWIQRQEEWGTFVSNRVSEIRSLTSSNSWRHVPGELNPADLPSRGCSPKQLVESKWWEGPRWLYDDPDLWPNRVIECDETQVAQERRKKLIALVNTTSDFWHLTYFSSYLKIVRMISWILRYINNLRKPDQRATGELTVEEIERGEKFIFEAVQTESFSGVDDMKIKHLGSFLDENGIIRLRTRISNRQDSENFRFPIVLPSKHPVTEKLILKVHFDSSHVGIQGVMSKLRENYWIMGGRRAIGATLSKCYVCKKYSSKPIRVDAPPLPLDRVRDACVFEVIGIDMAGPLHLKDGQKVWICIFTCAVYRAVHLELVTSMSTHSFVQALRRFVARRGRPKTIFSDNGTNFVGAENLLSQLDWQEVMKFSVNERIVWRFNPPSAPWWGGFWERLIGILKQLLRKVLGRASLDYEDLLTVICDCETVLNSRPLTYVSNDPHELSALTPAMFLVDQRGFGLPDYDFVDRSSVYRKLRYKQRLKDDLRLRFRNEYLGQLRIFYEGKPRGSVKLGDVVLIGNDQDKRMDWPLARVIELIPGKDKQIRLVRLVTSRGQLLRPVQRLYPLESVESASQADGPKDVMVSPAELHQHPPDSFSSDDSVSAGVSDKSRVSVKVTRSGRVTKPPIKFSM